MPEPAPTPPQYADQRLDQLLGDLLRFGVLLSAAVVILGGVIHLKSHGGDKAPTYRDFGGQTEELRHVDSVVVKAFSGDGQAIIQLGILLLIATPIARVLFSAFAFLLQRDYLYVGVTVLVLIILLYSLLFDG